MSALRPLQAFVTGPAGRLQLTISLPAGTPVGIAMISHPQPLLGGTPRHIVPHSAARRISEAGWIAVRPSFRGVDGSEGSYEEGLGRRRTGWLSPRICVPNIPTCPWLWWASPSAPMSMRGLPVVWSRCNRRMPSC
jgi:hypothetical protein